MPSITAVRPVLLSAPYADSDNLEVRVALPTGWRTTGLVEVTLDDGTTGLGEAYLAVFAPHVFTAIVDLFTPYLVGQEADDITARAHDLVLVSGYWSLQGAARHVVGAVETALIDAASKRAGVPAHVLLSASAPDDIALYASGGDSTSPAAMRSELEAVQGKGIDNFKIRARAHEADKAVWTLEEAARLGVAIAVDMAQNLADPGQTVAETLAFLDAVHTGTSGRLSFLEEALGPSRASEYPALRAATDVAIAGGEIVTTADELRVRIEAGWYDIVQPDVTVIGGMHQTLDVFAAARDRDVSVVVHCWGSAVCQAANYHVAFAGGGRLAEWPMPDYPLRQALLVEPFRVHGGRLVRPDAPGLGVVLDPGTERRFPFRSDAVYRCLAPLPVTPAHVWTD
jgi:L-alanine-DL-glutamate epimerase-like enolase superfamily enzyme